MGTLSGDMLMAVRACSECGQVKALGSRTICEACRKRILRAKQGSAKEKVGVSESGLEGQSAKRRQAAAEPTEQQPTPNETPEEWLARRVKETGSSGWQWLKTGTPPGARPSVKVPIKWTLEDIDQSIKYIDQWGKREVK